MVSITVGVKNVGHNLSVHGAVLHPLLRQQLHDVLLHPLPLILAPPLQHQPLPGILPLNSSAESVNVHGDEGVVRLLLSLVREREELVPAVLL